MCGVNYIKNNKQRNDVSLNGEETSRVSRRRGYLTRYLFLCFINLGVDVCRVRGDMGNGINKVLPDLYLGNFKDARDKEQLARYNITHILSIHDSAAPLLQEITYLCIPASDLPSQDLTQHFKESIMFIHECRLKGQGCLVHCLAGVSRSVTLVVAYIMTVTGLGWQDALAAVRVVRPCAGPNVGFLRQLEDFENTQVLQYRAWLKEKYKESPFDDEEEIKMLLSRSPKANGAEGDPRGLRTT